MALITQNVDIECDTYPDLHMISVTAEDGSVIGFVQFHNQLEEYKSFKEKTPNSRVLKAFWCGYVKVPPVWYEAVTAYFENKTHPIISENKIHSLPEITYVGTSPGGSNVLGWDHNHARDLHEYTDLHKVIREVKNTHLYCQLSIRRTNSE